MVKLARRALLQTAAGGVFLAPLLRARALQAQRTEPKRLILLFTPNSQPREFWPVPAASGTGFSLQGPLRDFVGLESQMLFVRRIDHAWSFDNHHEAGVAQLFTGQYFHDEATRYAAGPSLDQVLLRSTDLRGGTAIGDIHLCVADGGGGHRRHVTCYAGPGLPIQRESRPERAYRRIFAGLRFDQHVASRRAALQLHAAELRRMQTFLSGEERQRLELHAESLRDLERQLMHGPDAASCSAPSMPSLAPNDHDEATVRSWSKLQIDMIVNAFACDRTRVAELAFGASGSSHAGMLGLETATRSWHDVAHSSPWDDLRTQPIAMHSGPVAACDALIGFYRLWASQVAYLARRLAELREGDGTMLDNTLIYWGVESGTDHNHSPRDMPYLLIGGKKLGFATGQYLQGAQPRSANQLHTSVLHAFGHTTASGFGMEPDCGPLPGVLR
jgi:hypothetical protein